MPDFRTPLGATAEEAEVFFERRIAAVTKNLRLLKHFEANNINIADFLNGDEVAVKFAEDSGLLSNAEATAATAGSPRRETKYQTAEGRLKVEVFPEGADPKLPKIEAGAATTAGPLAFLRTPKGTSRPNAQPYYDVRRQFLAENPGIVDILKAQGMQPVDFVTGSPKALDVVEAATDGKPFQTTTPFPGTGNPPPATTSIPSQPELNLKSDELKDLRTPPKTPTSERKIWSNARKIYLQGNPLVAQILKERGIATVDFINGHPKVIDVVEQNLNAARQAPLSGQNVRILQGDVSQGSDVDISDFNLEAETPANAEVVRKKGFRARFGRGAKATAGVVKNPGAAVVAGNKGLANKIKGITPAKALKFAKTASIYGAVGLATDYALGELIGTGDYENLFKPSNAVRDRTVFGQGENDIAEIGENVILVHKSSIPDVERGTKWRRVENPNVQTGPDHVAYIGRPDEGRNLVSIYQDAGFEDYLIPGNLESGSYDGQPNFNYKSKTGSPYHFKYGAAGPILQGALERFEGFGNDHKEFGSIASENDIGTYGRSLEQAREILGQTELADSTESGPGAVFSQDPNDGIEGGFQSTPPQAAPLQIDPVIQEILKGFGNVNPQQSAPVDTSGLEEFAVQLQNSVGREPQQYPTLKTPGPITKGEEQGIRGNTLLDNISSAINSELDERGALQQLAVDLLRSPLGQETARRDKLRDEAENLRLDKQFTENSSASQDNLAAQTTSDQTTGNVLTGLASVKATDRRTTSSEAETVTSAQLQGLRATLDAALSSQATSSQGDATRALEEKNRIDQNIERERLRELARQFDTGQLSELAVQIQTNFGQGVGLPGVRR